MNEVIAGGLYRHYKGGNYRVVAVATHEATREVHVVYRPLNEDGVYIRSFEDFTAMVVVDNVATPRFALIEEGLHVDWEGYQRESRATAIYPNHGTNPIYPTLGLVGEAGEVANVVKKMWRDHEGDVTQDDRRRVADELGDVLWYLVQLATELHISFADIARLNLQKIGERYKKV